MTLAPAPPVAAFTSATKSWVLYDGAVGAELQTRVRLVLRADGDDHLGTERLRKLDRHGSDAGRAAVNQKRFAFLQRAALEHVVPDRHQRFRRRAGFLHREGRWHRHRLGVLRDTILRIAAAGDQRHHLVAELVLLRAVAKRDHFARDFKAGQIACTWRRRIAAGALRHIGPVDAGRVDFHEDFARSRNWHGTLLRQQHLRAAGFADADHGHLRGQLFHHVSFAGGSMADCHIAFLRRSEMSSAGRRVRHCAPAKVAANSRTIAARGL
jgi:hypothetical protein